MKKYLLIPILVFSMLGASYAQMQKGSWMLDGMVGLSFGDNISSHQYVGSDRYEQDVRVSQAEIRTGIGYFVKDNLVMGMAPSLGGGWARFQYQSQDPIHTNSLRYGLGLFTRKYVPAGEKLSFYAELGAEVTKIHRKTKAESSGEKKEGVGSSGFGGSANLGIQYLLSPHVGLLLQSPLLTYSYSEYAGGEEAPDYGGSYTEFDVGLFSSFQIGATLFF